MIMARTMNKKIGIRPDCPVINTQREYFTRFKRKLVPHNLKIFTVNSTVNYLNN